MPRDLGQNNENRQTDENKNDWERIDSEFQHRADLQKKWDAEHDPSPDFERSARPLGPDYGADRPRYREIPPEVAAEFGRTPEELQALRERDPRGAGRHARLSPDVGPSDPLADRGERPAEAARHDVTRTDEPSRIGPGHLAETPRYETPGRTGQHARLGDLPLSDSRPSEPPLGEDRSTDGRPSEGRLSEFRTAELRTATSPPERPLTEAGEHIRPVERGDTTDRRGLGDRLGLEQTPPGRREAPRHLREVSIGELGGAARDATEAEVTRTERAYPPSWLTSADRPPPVEQTRTYNEVGHLDEPLPSEQRALEEVVPRDEQGSFERFSDPRQDWTAEVNGVGPILEPGRGSNCMDCTMSAVSTWHGEPRVSAPRHAEYDPNRDPVRTGERDGPQRAERWLGHDFEMVDEDAASAFPEIERRMLDAGHGASAVIVNGWAPGGAHAWNAFNYEGKVYWVDTQLGDVSERPLYPQAIDVRAIMMDGEGNKA